jgi:hypothetical protein
VVFLPHLPKFLPPPIHRSWMLFLSHTLTLLPPPLHSFRMMVIPSTYLTEYFPIPIHSSHFSYFVFFPYPYIPPSILYRTLLPEAFAFLPNSFTVLYSLKPLHPPSILYCTLLPEAFAFLPNPFTVLYSPEPLHSS